MDRTDVAVSARQSILSEGAVSGPSPASLREFPDLRSVADAVDPIQTFARHPLTGFLSQVIRRLAKHVQIPRADMVAAATAFTDRALANTEVNGYSPLTPFFSKATSREDHLAIKAACDIVARLHGEVQWVITQTEKNKMITARWPISANVAVVGLTFEELLAKSAELSDFAKGYYATLKELTLRLGIVESSNLWDEEWGTLGDALMRALTQKLDLIDPSLDGHSLADVRRKLMLAESSGTLGVRYPDEVTPEARMMLGISDSSALTDEEKEIRLEVALRELFPVAFADTLFDNPEEVVRRTSLTPAKCFPEENPHRNRLWDYETAVLDLLVAALEIFERERHFPPEKKLSGDFFNRLRNPILWFDKSGLLTRIGAAKSDFQKELSKLFGVSYEGKASSNEKLFKERVFVPLLESGLVIPEDCYFDREWPEVMGRRRPDMRFTFADVLPRKYAALCGRIVICEIHGGHHYVPKGELTPWGRRSDEVRARDREKLSAFLDFLAEGNLGLYVAVDETACTAAASLDMGWFLDFGARLCSEGYVYAHVGNARYRRLPSHPRSRLGAADEWTEDVPNLRLRIHAYRPKKA